MRHRHLIVFGAVAAVAWLLETCAFIYFAPRLFYNAARTAVVRHGLGIQERGIPVNTIFAMPTLASPSLSKSPWIKTGNRDTLYAIGGLDLSQGPQVLHVPEMDGRYYSIELVDPWLDIFTDIGRRTRGNRIRDYLISGPHWKGAVPVALTQIASPSNSVMLLGRVLVEGDGDLATAYDLAQQIRVAPLTAQ